MADAKNVMKKFQCARCGYRDIHLVPHRSRCPRCGNPIMPDLPWDPEVNVRRAPSPPL